MEWETVIGLEVHTQLLTRSKLFSGASTAYGKEPNTQACFIDLAMPGVLPVLNKEAVRMGVRFGLSINAEIHKISAFERKNYFYPDLPKGYQISQFKVPVVGKGQLTVAMEDGSVKKIGITRAHLEEDAGKSLHDALPYMTGIDLNRAGTPLLEIVSEPDMRSAKEAVAYLKTLHSLVCYLGICDGNMQEGSFRCDVNVSVRPKGQTTFGTRVELKNINSFRFVERAIYFEVDRQIQLLESNGKIVQETRLYDSVNNVTRSMRSKEDANDYRYFPDPDLLPVVIDDEFIDAIRQTLPELPDQKQKRFMEELGLSAYDAAVLVANKSLSDYFEQVVAHSKQAKLSANWVTGELLAMLNKHSLAITDSPVSAEQLGLLIQRITDNTISGKIAKTVFQTMWESKQSPDEIITAQGLRQVSDSSEIEKVIDRIIANNPEQLAQYRSGKDKLFGYFVGQVMKEMQGKANPNEVNECLKRKL